MLYPLFIFVVLFSHGNPSFGEVSSSKFRSFQKLELPAPAMTSEAIAFDKSGGGPYASVVDGRVLKWQKDGFVDFAFTSPSRSKQECDGSSDPAKEFACGRPLGMEFNIQTGDLYIADAYHGLHVVGPKGGKATQLATEAEGVPFKFLNTLDIDQPTGIVYFTDASSRFQRRDFGRAIIANDTSGRLMKYDPKTKQVTVLLKGLGLPNGLAVSKDGSFVLVAEYITGRTQRYWLKGPKANRAELFWNRQVLLPGSISRNAQGEFWMVANGGEDLAWGNKVSEEGQILDEVDFDKEYLYTLINEVYDYNGALYLASGSLSYVGVFSN